jgi:hypothetical protein
VNGTQRAFALQRDSDPLARLLQSQFLLLQGDPKSSALVAFQKVVFRAKGAKARKAKKSRSNKAKKSKGAKLGTEFINKIMHHHVVLQKKRAV